jgi:hypothetical protein
LGLQGNTIKVGGGVCKIRERERRIEGEGSVQEVRERQKDGGREECAR